ncbi:MAG: GNAT family N-acetyltransferase [Oscillospiraceae bacterium]|nr:GNAT family N-acetyltransferase [Oscillospiraceae bacterium]
MKRISKDSMMNRLRENVFKNMHELETLQSFPNVECFLEGDIGIIVFRPTETYCTVSLVMDSGTDLSKISFSELGIDACPQVVVSVNGCDALIEERPDIAGFSYDKTYKSFVKEAGMETGFRWSIRELAPGDQDLAENCTIHAEEERPSFREVFTMLIGEKTGRILACVDHDEIVGYLAFVQSIDPLLDVAELYVKKEYRGKGIATDLGRKYANTVLSEGKIPYWSNAVSIGSERAAEKSGFSRCCSHLYYRKAALV